MYTLIPRNEKKGAHTIHRVSALFLACLKALVTNHEIEVDLVRWPINKEAPFQLNFAPGIRVFEREDLSLDDLLELLENDPDIVLTSGWVDKDYLAVCKAAAAQEIPTVMCSDTAWRGDLKQWAAVFAAKFWINSTFSHAWVSGEKQAQYARKLGIWPDNILTGFYSADVPAFAHLAASLEQSKSTSMPHKFLCVARYISTKGHQYMCEAFAELCEEGLAKDWELICAGTGELYPLKFAHERIQHIGFVQPADLPEIQKNCSVFLLPSIYEPWGVVVQEHALAGFPLLLSSAVGAKERFLKTGKNGFEFIAGDKEELKQVMLKMINASDAELLEMGSKSIALGRAHDPSLWANLLVKQMDS